MSFIMSTLPKAYSFVSLSLRPRFIIFTLFSLLISFKILLLTNNFSIPRAIKIIRLEKQSIVALEHLSIETEPPKWLKVIQGDSLGPKRALGVGLINFEANHQSSLALGGIVEPVNINLKHVSPNVTWETLFPGRTRDESSEKCPDLPMPKPMDYPKLDVVVAQLPCGEMKEGYNKSEMEGIRDVHRLQVSLATAHAIVENAIGKQIKPVYGVFIAKCEPMVELFRCDDLIWQDGEYWIYRPNVERLREIINMPIGACELARPYVGAQGRRKLQAKLISKYKHMPMIRPREAYVTMLHSSESYVCGAIALAQSILLTNTTRDLILLADNTISNHSIAGLQAGGWKIKRVERIRSPYAKLKEYNAWNYSKLRVWQLTEYSKVMFIDSDFLVLKNIDHFFDYPQLSAAPNDGVMFNSGVMIVEPSECFLKTLMNKRFTLKSYNGGDQGYLNEVLTYWHRLSTKLNYLKFFEDDLEPRKRVVKEDQHSIHFLGLKPWSCYRDYDCNWDHKLYYSFASDNFHALWWQVHDTMPKVLQSYCTMTEEQDSKIRQRKAWARHGNHPDGHWKNEIKDPRQFNLVKSA